MKNKTLILVFVLLTAAPVMLDSYSSFATVQNQESSLWPRHKHHRFGFRIRTPRPRPMVYVCNDEESMLFHRDPNCVKLSGCRSDVYRITKHKARVMGLRRCPVCF